MKRVLLLVSLILMFVPGIAFAQESGQLCTGLADDPVWVDGIKFVKSAVEAQSWDEALTQARQLYAKCPSSPILNYYIARCLQGQNDKIKSLQYYQLAADKTSEIATGPDSSRMIWYARYEAEHPERTDKAIAERQSRLDASEAKNVELKAALDEAKATRASELAKAKREAALEAKQDASLGMWTGTGIGVVGIGLLATGAVLAFRGDTYDHYVVPDDEGDIKFEITTNENDEKYRLKYKVETKPKYITGLTLFGAGLGMILTGSIMAGIYGYKYSHVNLDDNAELSFSIMPQNVGMSLIF